MLQLEQCNARGYAIAGVVYSLEYPGTRGSPVGAPRGHQGEGPGGTPGAPGPEGPPHPQVTVGIINTSIVRVLTVGL